MRFLLRHPVLILFLLGVLGLSYLVYDKAQQQPAGSGFSGRPGAGAGAQALVTVATVTRQTLADQVESVGTTAANESINITAKVSETVSKVHFEDGIFAREGDVLLELTNAAEASRLAEAQASASEARRQFERLEGLIKNKLVSSTDLSVARTNMETAEARLEGVLVSMSDRVVRAPFSGVLGFRNVSAGSLVSPGTVITTLDDISTIKLDFTIPEVYLADIHVGQKIKAHSVVYADREFEGIVRVVGSRVDPVTRSVSVRAHIDNPEATLRPGMLLTVAMGLNEHEATVVPEESVIVSQGHQYVFVIDDENIARQVEITLGRRRPGMVEVLSGLIPGQRVVTQGVAQVRPGQPVRILVPESQGPDQAS
ncbi:MAG: efflux RND transporter periplasmic adaptor subunit [Pseudomonadales bacterium]|nr:efflux RND transporter periplasmic adaptor subunit [Pseudomonadales bacterium]